MTSAGENSQDRPGVPPLAAMCSSRWWENAAPPGRTSSRLRNGPGSRDTARSSSAMLSAAQFEVAFPAAGRSPARHQVLSQVARFAAEPDPALVGGLDVLLLRGREHDRGVQLHHRDPAQLAAGDLQPREPFRMLRQQHPPVPPELGHRRVHAAQLQLPDLGERPPHRRGRRHRPDHRPQVPQALEVTDRLPTQDLGLGQIQQQDLAEVIDRVEPSPGHRRRQPNT